MRFETRIAVAWSVILVMLVLGLVCAVAGAWLGVVVAVAGGANGVLLLRNLRQADKRKRS